jgi:hypothetical protein
MLFTVTLNVEADSIEAAKKQVLGNIPGITSDNIQSVGGRIRPFKTDSNSHNYNVGFRTDSVNSSGSDDGGDEFEKISLDTDTDRLQAAQDLRMIRISEKHKRK